MSDQPRKSRPSSRHDNGEMVIESIVSGKDHSPYVQISMTSGSAQMDIEKAMETAMYIMEAAEAAVSDAYIWKFFKEKIDLDDARTAQLVADFREYRATFPIVRGWYNA